MKRIELTLAWTLLKNFSLLFKLTSYKEHPSKLQPSSYKIVARDPSPMYKFSAPFIEKKITKIPDIVAEA